MNMERITRKICSGATICLYERPIIMETCIEHNEGRKQLPATIYITAYIIRMTRIGTRTMEPFKFLVVSLDL